MFALILDQNVRGEWSGPGGRTVRPINSDFYRGYVGSGWAERLNGGRSAPRAWMVSRSFEESVQRWFRLWWSGSFNSGRSALGHGRSTRALTVFSDMQSLHSNSLVFEQRAIRFLNCVRSANTQFSRVYSATTTFWGEAYLYHMPGHERALLATLKASLTHLNWFFPLYISLFA
jgi:hypothetical protein